MKNRYFIQMQDKTGEWQTVSNLLKTGRFLKGDERVHYFIEPKADELISQWQKEYPAYSFRKIKVGQLTSPPA